MASLPEATISRYIKVTPMISSLVSPNTSCKLKANGYSVSYGSPDSKVHGSNMGPIWGRQDPVGPHIGPMNLAIWEFVMTDFQEISMEIMATAMTLWVFVDTPVM